MKSIIGFGKFHRFYWLIIGSALIKVLMSVFLRLEYQSTDIITKVSNFSIVKYPYVNDHIFIYFIYYYFGFIFFGSIFYCIKRTREKNTIEYKKNFQDIGNNTIYKINVADNASLGSNKSNEYSLLPPIFFILLVCFIYMTSEMITFYLDQKNHNNVCFWMLEIFFIHCFL